MQCIGALYTANFRDTYLNELMISLLYSQLNTLWSNEHLKSHIKMAVHTILACRTGCFTYYIFVMTEDTTIKSIYIHILLGISCLYLELIPGT